MIKATLWISLLAASLASCTTSPPSVAPIAPSSEMGEPTDYSNPKGELTVYANPHCHYCVELKNYLQQNNVPHIYKNIRADKNSYTEFKSYGGTGTPFSTYKTPFGTEAIRGFDRAKFAEIAAAYR